MIPVFFWLSIGVILYTYLGYPLIVFLLAQLWPKPKPYPPATPSVTLLIPAYNEETVIAKKLENSLSLDYPPEYLHILVVNDGSDDRTADIVRQYVDRGVELYDCSGRQGKMLAINQAMSQVRGEILVLTDATNFFDPHVLRELTVPFADPTVGVVTGAKTILKGDGVLGESEGLYWRYEAFIQTHETRLGCCTAVTGDSMAIRRSLFEPLPYAGIGAIDFHMAMQILRRGYRIVYRPHVRSYERVAPSAQHEMERRARMIAGRYQAMALAYKWLPLNRPLIVWQMLSHKFLRPLIPFAMIVALLTNMLAVFWPIQAEKNALWHLSPPINWIVLGLQGVFYGLAVLGTRIKLQGYIGKLLYLPTFLVNSNFAALAGLFRFLAGRQTPLWKRVPRREEHE